MQLNRLGVVLIAFFGLAGLGMLVVPAAVGAEATIAGILGLIGVIWVFVAVGFLVYFRGQRLKAARQDRIFKTGVKATATIVSAGSHMTVNEMPLMSLQLDLDVPGAGVTRVRRREAMPVFAAIRMKPGLVLPAYVDPGGSGEFILVW